MRSRWQSAGGRSFATAIGALLAAIPLCGGDTVRIPVKTPGAGPLFQIHYGRKWGYMDRTGTTVIPRQFDDEGDFFGGLARTRMGAKWGFIDEKGRTVIPYRFDDSGNFKEGLAPVLLDRRWGFIDAHGAFVVEPRFQGAGDFSDGMAEVEIWKKVRCGTTPYDGDNAPTYALRLHVTPGGSCVPMEPRYGFIDKAGRIPVPPTLGFALPFSERFAPFQEPSTGGAPLPYGYIDKTGRVVIPPQFDQAGLFSDGLALVSVRPPGKEELRWGYIDHSGRFVVPPTFPFAYSFSEGLASVQNEDGAWGFINTGGAFAIAPRFERANPFADGLALVTPSADDPEDDDYYVDRTGAKMLAPRFPVWPFSDGLTVVGGEGSQRYMNKRGQIVAPYEVHPEP